jgi:hypothetical protein
MCRCQDEPAGFGFGDRDQPDNRDGRRSEALGRSLHEAEMQIASHDLEQRQRAA